MIAQQVPYFSWNHAWTRGHPGLAVKAVVVPHPSGRSLWWNGEENRAKALAFFSHIREHWRP